MGTPKGSQFQAERAPYHANGSSGADVDNRPAASPQGVALVAAYSSEDDDHGHDDAQLPPTPAIFEAKPAFPQAPAGGCSEERASPTTTAAEAVNHAANGMNSGESSSSPGAAAVVVASAAHHDHPPTPGASPSTTPLSADAAGVVKEGEEGDGCITTTAHDASTPTADGSSNANASGGGGGGGTSGRSHDGRVSVLCRFRCVLGREGERGSSRERRSGSGSDWLSFGGGGRGGEVEHDGGGGEGADTVSVRMGGVWSRRGFDKVFKPGVEQVEVYNEVKRVAHGVSQGFNGTIFAYGQTGSGKTYTMGGSADTLSFTAAPRCSSSPGPRSPSIVAPDFDSATTTTDAASAPSPSACAAATPTNTSSPCGLSPTPSPTAAADAGATTTPTTTTTTPPSLSPATLMMPPPPPPPPPDSGKPRGGGGSTSKSAAAAAAAAATAAGAAAVALSPATASTTRCLGGDAGVIPRAVSTLLADAEARRAQGWEFALTATYVEIYNERIRDLLNPANDNLQVKESPSSGLHAAGAKEIRVSSLEEAVGVLRSGAEHRATASTLMNNASSRSHSIFMLRLDQRDVVRDCKISARLTLVDLAGSERAAKTGAEGKRLEEANSINVSLHTLGRVIRTLSESGPHVPFRDSKLTRLLQESLGGNSRTVLIICCSPEEEQAQETLSTLKFGECAKRVTTFASANVVAAPDEVGAQLAQLRAEVVRLKRQLHDSQLREARRNEAMASMGGRRSSRSSMGAGGGGGTVSALRRRWGASPLSRPASFNNASSFASDMVNSSGDESWSAAVSNTRGGGGGGVWEQGESSWTGAGAAGIATAPSPSTPGWKPGLLAQPQSPLNALVSPTMSPDADQAGHRPRSGGRSSWSRERAPEQPVSAAEFEGGETTKGAAASEQAASGRPRRQGQEEEDAVADADGTTVGVGDIRKAAEGCGATAETPQEREEDGHDEARESLRAALERVEGLERGWVERVKAYEKLLRLKDLRIESLMLLHNHRQGKTAGEQHQRDEEAAAANGDGDGGSKLAGGGGGAAAGSRSASATPTRRKTKGAVASSTAGGGGRKKRSPRDRRSPRNAGATARGNLRSSPPRRAGRGPAADPPGGGVGKRAAFPAAPPPSPMMPKDKLKHFSLEDTDTDSD